MEDLLGKSSQYSSSCLCYSLGWNGMALGSAKLQLFLEHDSGSLKKRENIMILLKVLLVLASV